MDRLKYLITGTGGIGGALGAFPAKAGKDVSSRMPLIEDERGFRLEW